MAQAPMLARIMRGRFKLVTVSFFLGFGLTACSSSGGSESSDEPVTADAVQPAEGADQAAAAAGEGAPAASEDMAQAPPAEDPAMPVDDMDGTKAEAKADSESPPPTVMDTPTDTVNAELTADQAPGDGAPVATEASSPDTLTGALEPEPAISSAPTTASAAVAADQASGNQIPMETAPAAMADGGNSVSSPGAARNIQGRHEGHHAKHHKGHHDQAPVASSAAAAGDASGAYVVQPGDTLGTIAAKVYGSKREWKSLADMNGLTATSVIHPGDTVRFDASNPKAQSFAKAYHGAMKTVEVKAGDTLCKLAAEIYGSPAAWKMLFNYNKAKIQDPNRIGVGMKLDYMDTGAKVEQAAAKPAVQPVKMEQKVAQPKAATPKAMKKITKTGKGSAKVADKSGAKSGEKAGKKHHKKAPISPEDVAE